MPRVSVVLTARNEEAVIGDAIRSILAQDFSDFEVIVVDDGSTDRTAAVAEAFGDSRVRVVRQANTGQPLAMNRGIGEALGEFIARHDADDLSLPARFRAQVEFLDRHPSVALVGTAAFLRAARGRDQVFQVAASDAHIRQALGWGNPFVHSAVMMRWQALDQVGLYQDMLFEDYDLWIRLAEAFPLANIREPLVVRRVREGSRGRAGRRSDALTLKARLQRRAIERLRLPAVSWVGVVPTWLGAAMFATIERLGGMSPGAARRA